MRKFIDIIRESVTPQTVEEIAHYLWDLAPDEVGVEVFGDLTVRFEGFSQMCWDDAKEKGKTIAGLEHEMIEDWKKRHPALKLVASGWTNGDEFYTETMFYAVFRERDQTLSEGVDSVFVRIENEYYDDTAEVFRNPSRVLFQKQIQETRHARGFLDLEKNEVWVWFAPALHGDVDHERIGGHVWLTWNEPFEGEVLIQYDAESLDMIDPDSPDFDGEVERLIAGVRPFARIVDGYKTRIDHR